MDLERLQRELVGKSEDDSAYDDYSDWEDWNSGDDRR